MVCVQYFYTYNNFIAFFLRSLYNSVKIIKLKYRSCLQEKHYFYETRME
uniref:Uncharacterized protein n=1 Tax=Anguilla anguilla TaxID=7936 RepID=A0A0E9WGZ4_ANGAN